MDVKKTGPLNHLSLFVDNKSYQINFYMLSDQERGEMFQHMKTGK